MAETQIVWTNATWILSPAAPLLRPVAPIAMLWRWPNHLRRWRRETHRRWRTRATTSRRHHRAEPVFEGFRSRLTCDEIDEARRGAWRLARAERVDWHARIERLGDDDPGRRCRQRILRGFARANDRTSMRRMKLHESLLGCFCVVKAGAARPRRDGQHDPDFKTPPTGAVASKRAPYAKLTTVRISVPANLVPCSRPRRPVSVSASETRRRAVSFPPA
jgi:hypothetical protein